MAHRRVRAPPPSQLRRRLSVLLLALFSFLLFLALLNISASVLRRANDLGRRCLANTSAFSGISTSAMTRTLKIAMVSLSKEEISDGVERPTRRRSFRGVMAAVGGNKRAYAARMGYDFVDAHDLVDPGRPPSWSKIVAVRSQLPSHDWVFWNDADTVVTNPDISLENILGAVIGQADFETSPDLVVTEDVNGINAGVFFVRRSNWSENFLETWWNLTSFVRFGSTKSGDNDALKYLISNLSSHELRSHVRISPMQCLFNSYPWYPSWKSVHQLIFSSGAVWRGLFVPSPHRLMICLKDLLFLKRAIQLILQIVEAISNILGALSSYRCGLLQDHFYDHFACQWMTGVYSRGDFMVHLAGLDDKKEWADRIIQEIEAERRDYVYLARQRPLYTP